jgi:hypothetical protein
VGRVAVVRQLPVGVEVEEDCRRGHVVEDAIVRGWDDLKGAMNLSLSPTFLGNESPDS